MFRSKFSFIVLLFCAFLTPGYSLAQQTQTDYSKVAGTSTRVRREWGPSNHKDSIWEEAVLRQESDDLENETTGGDAMANDSEMDHAPSTSEFDREDEDSNFGETNSRIPTLSQWPKLAITEISIDPRDLDSNVPRDRSEYLIQKQPRNWNTFECCEKIFMWQAPDIRHYPLYFENVGLERYGQSRNEFFQPAVSAVHFFSSAFLLPLHMRQDPAYSYDTPLGYCRPGNCTQRIYQRQFWNVKR